ncbi:hypothetical protein U1Q18_044579 [Sarracenia purpurea var. burkii]
MAIPMTFTIFTLSALFLVSATLSISDAPFIVAHKKATLTKLESGAERVSVVIDVYNRGSAAAYDISLADNTWDQDVFDVVSGNTTKTWERLDAGSLVSHFFELVSKVKSTYNGAPAVITFRILTKAKLQEAYSTPILPLDILADKIPEKKFELRFFTKHSSLITVICIVVLSGHRIADCLKHKVAAVSTIWGYE